MKNFNILALAVIVIVVASCGGGASEPAAPSIPDELQVAPPNQPPIVSAGNDQTVDEGSTINLSATASDPDGTISSYQWVQIEGASANSIDLNSQNISFFAPEVSSDNTMVFEVTVTDNNQATASDLVSINIKDTNSGQTSMSLWEFSEKSDDHDKQSLQVDPDSTIEYTKSDINLFRSLKEGDSITVYNTEKRPYEFKIFQSENLIQNKVEVVKHRAILIEENSSENLVIVIDKNKGIVNGHFLFSESENSYSFRVLADGSGAVVLQRKEYELPEEDWIDYTD